MSWTLFQLCPAKIKAARGEHLPWPRASECASIRRMSKSNSSTVNQPGTSPAAESAGERYLALDAFRGFIMFVLAANGFGFASLKADPTYGRIASWFDHVDWEGGVFWDMIQPAFMFMVGMAMPFALARRLQQGASRHQILGHVAARAFRLLLLSQFLMIVHEQRVHFQLINVLAQIAFTYLLTYLIIQLRVRWQVVAALVLLGVHWLLFVIFPGPEGPFSKTGNVGQVIDFALLGYNYPGYYVTINFISSTVTTLFGAWAGMLLMSARPQMEKLRMIALAALGAFVSGLGLGYVNPIVKRIWTASFTLYSAGWVLLMLLAFVIIIDVWGQYRLAFPWIVVGMNSIFIYSAGFLIKDSVLRWINPFTGQFSFMGRLAPVAQACAVMVVLWCLCYWLYRRKIFLKV